MFNVCLESCAAYQIHDLAGTGAGGKPGEEERLPPVPAAARDVRAQQRAMHRVNTTESNPKLSTLDQ